MHGDPRPESAASAFSKHFPFFGDLFWPAIIRRSDDFRSCRTELGTPIGTLARCERHCPGNALSQLLTGNWRASPHLNVLRSGAALGTLGAWSSVSSPTSKPPS